MDAKLFTKVRRQLFSILGLLVSEFAGQIYGLSYQAGLNDELAITWMTASNSNFFKESKSGNSQNFIKVK